MEEKISKLEDRNTEMIQVEEERELKFLKSEPYNNDLTPLEKPT